MRTQCLPADSAQRRGAVLVLAALLLIVIFAFTAFTIDIGYITITNSELQNAADAAALAGCTDLPYGPLAVRTTARDIGGLNRAAGSGVSIPDADIQIGVFNFATKVFVPNETAANAVRVTTRVQDEPFFFAPILGQNQFDTHARATAMLNPRDIVFVVDLSGSMNDDTEPCWAPNVIASTFAGGTAIANGLMQDLYDDFGFGAYPGTVAHVGSPLVAADVHAYAELTKDDGPLTNAGLAASYRISNSDSEIVRKEKAYRWMIDTQIASLMPSANPPADSATQYDFWQKYLDYVIESATVGEPPPPSGGGGGGSGSGGGSSPPSPPLGWLDDLPRFAPSTRPRPTECLVASALPAFALEFLLTQSAPATFTGPGVPRNGSVAQITLPPDHDDSFEVDDFNNPNNFTFPSASGSLPDTWRNKIGYVTYVQFLMDWGRDRKPLWDNSVSAAPGATPKTPLSVASVYCPMHNEATAGGTFAFPPREQPMHAVRRSLIAAIQVVKQRNAAITPGLGDRVAIVTFDAFDAYHTPQVVLPLTANYSNAMQACTTLQAVSDIGSTTATEIGLRVGRDHLRNVSDGGQGRSYAEKVLVLLTDGVPNVWESSQSTLDSYAAANPSGEYYGSGYIWYNAALVQAARAKAERTTLYPVGMGMGTDYDFMDRMARIAGTDEGGLSPRGSGDPSAYEVVLTQTLDKIIKNPGSRLVE